MSEHFERDDMFLRTNWWSPMHREHEHFGKYRLAPFNVEAL